ncbi:gastrin/cholecystokinin type B receptor-like [Acanthaster planci]|uniref:Gastrin/cholecystokinin type B receptor-like n=1 Tax=Acanthaster planci TaxID=133434 RepID=A0A8B7Z3U6_ACAPL|nr:gastrin/cholecystokinin type B receptor-like [Acanthaster planci]
MNSTQTSRVRCIVSDNGAQVSEVAAHLAYSVLVFGLGVSGNCLILCVYWGKIRKSTTDALIKALALVDFMVCVHHLVYVVVWSVCLAGATVSGLWISTFDYVNRVWIGTSVLITGLIALDRYDSVCRPQRRWMTTSRTKKAVVCAFITAAAGHVPIYIIEVVVGDTASWGPHTLSYALKYMYRFVVFVTVVVIILVCYAQVFLAIRRHVRVAPLAASENTESTQRQPSVMTKQTPLSNHHVPQIGNTDLVSNQETAAGSTDGVAIPKPARWRETEIAEKGPKGSGNCPGASAAVRECRAAVPRSHRLFFCKRCYLSPLQRKTTAMLFVTSVVFVLSWLPYWITAVCCFFDVKLAIAEVSTELFYINNVANPVIYGVANRRFREESKQVLRRVRRCWSNA